LASKSEIEAVIKLAGNISPSLKAALFDAQRRLGDVGKTAGIMSKAISSAFSFAASGAAVGAVGIGAGLLLVAKQGLSLASDLNEVQNVVDTTFGKGATQISEWSKTAKNSYRLGELAAKKYSGTLGALMKSSGISSEHLVSMSENLTGLSGDFASFYNLKTDEAFDKIRAGISGESEPLRQLGINMSVANLGAYAMSKGIKTAWDKMSEADQVMLRYNYLLNASKDAQGDFGKTSGSFANQIRLIQTNFQELAGKIMDTSIPAFEKLFQQGNKLMDSFAKNPEKIQKLSEAVAQVVDKVISYIPIAIKYAKDFGNVLGDLYDGAKRVYHFISDNWSWIAPIIYSIVAAIASWKLAMGIVSLVKNVTTAINALKIAFAFLRISKLQDAATTLYLQGLYAKDAIVKGISAAATWAMVTAGNAWNIITKIGAISTRAFGVAMAFVTSPIGLVILAVAALGVGIYLLIKHWDNVVAAMKGAWEWFQNLISKIPDLAFVLAGPLAPLLLLIKHFEKVKELASGAFSAVKKFFGFGGDNKDGSTDLSSVPKFASGGFANQASIFGEAGPEAAIPLKRTPRSLSLLSKTAQALGVGSGGSANSGGATFVYSPTYGSGTSESQVKQDFEDFKAMCEKWMDSRRRESFG
jgi:hypothetical protein